MADDIRDELRPVIEAVGLRRSAELAGVASSNLSAWLAGKPKLGDEAVARLAVALRDYCREQSQQFWRLADQLDAIIERAEAD